MMNPWLHTDKGGPRLSNHPPKREEVHAIEKVDNYSYLLNKVLAILPLLEIK
jgi:hypothetical protein